MTLASFNMDQSLLEGNKKILNEDREPIIQAETHLLESFDERLPCFGCGIGWFSFLLGFVFPLLWYYATILYFGNYYRKEPRERLGLAASAIAALVFTVTALVTVAAILL